MKNRNKILLALIIIVIVVIVSFPAIKNYMVYNMGKRDVKSETAAYTITSKAIVAEFMANEASANKKYNNKPVVITGIVTSVDGKIVFVDETVNCKFVTAIALKVGKSVTIKGRVEGFDDTFGEVQLDECNLSTNK